METFLNETQLSEMLGISLACVRRWRLIGEGPEYKKIGPLVRYRYLAVMQWVESQPTGGNGHRIEPSTLRTIQRSSTVSRRMRPLKPQSIRVLASESKVG
jgi:predicted DNA-binding transcriptional regulator AlpA